MKSSYTQNPQPILSLADARERQPVNWKARALDAERALAAHRLGIQPTLRTAVLENALTDILEAFDSVREGITYHHESRPGAVRLHHAMDAARGLVGGDA